MPSMAPDACARGQPIFDDLRRQSRAAWSRAPRSAARAAAASRCRSPLTRSARYSRSEEYQRPDIADSSRGALRLVARERGAQRLRELAAGLERIGRLEPRARGLEARDRPREQPRRTAGCGPVEHREVELIDHEDLAREPAPVLLDAARRRTPSARLRGRADALAPADDVGPERNARRGDVAPRTFSRSCQHVELLDIRALEAGARRGERPAGNRPRPS